MNLAWSHKELIEIQPQIAVMPGFEFKMPFTRCQQIEHFRRGQIYG